MIQDRNDFMTIDREKEIKEQERERINNLIINKCEGLIKSRNILNSYRSKHSISISQFRRFMKNILFWIDNPDYIRISERKSSEGGDNGI